MARTTRITEQLEWPSLKEVFFIGTRVHEELVRDKSGHIVMVDGQPKSHKVGKFVNELQEAIDDGKLDALVLEAANLYHGGNVQAVLAAMARNLDSQKSNMKNRDYAPNAEIDKIRLNTMYGFVNARREAKTRSSEALPQWAFGPKEIDEINDLHKLQAVINSINDACCDKAHGSYKSHLGENYVEVAKANRTYAQKRKELLKAQADAVDPNILAKLGQGKKVTLTADQAAQLIKLLSK